MNFTRSMVLLAGVLALSACQNGIPGFGSGKDDAANGANGANALGAEGVIEESSIAFFNTTVGDRILFLVDQSTLTPEAIAVLDGQANWLNSNPQYTATIEGHADEQGTREYNLGLGALGGPAVLRLDQMEQQLRAVTGQVEQLRFRIDQIVADGTRRIGDLEFRLVELEGGDLSALGDTPTLGGDSVEMASILPSQPADVENGGVELAVAEEADFDAATQSLGGAYLDSFTTQPSGSYAPQALLRVGLSLSQLGKVENACQTLGEVLVRFPDSGVIDQVRTNQIELGCS